MFPRFTFLAVTLAFAANPLPAAAPEKFPAGDGRFEFTAWGGPALPVFFHAPAAITPATKIVFVMHGQGRNGDEYRDQWSELAARYGFLLLVPTFGNRDFPGFESYNYGNVIGPDGRRRPPAQWAFTAIERLFDHVKATAGLTTPTYFIYGHSAGAQFVHRYLYFMPEARVATAVAANAGWWTMPDRGVDFPYGLRASAIDERMLRAMLARHLIVLLGTADTDPHADNLRRTPEALAQGPHRFARGNRFFESGKSAANCTFNWSTKSAS